MRRIRIAVVIGLVALLTAPAALSVVSSQEINKASRLHRKGERAMRGGKIDAAKKAFQDALAVVSSFPSSHIGLGQIAMGEKDFERALGHFEQARDGYKELGEALFDIRTKRYADAQNQIATIEDQIRHLESQPSTGGSSASGGMLQINISKMRNQISQLQAIEPPDPNEIAEAPGEIHFYIGNALYQLGRRQEALGSWETCRDKSPKFAMVYNNLALIYMELGRLDEAKASLDQAEELGFPVNPQFREDLSRAISNRPS